MRRAPRWAAGVAVLWLVGAAAGQSAAELRRMGETRMGQQRYAAAAVYFGRAAQAEPSDPSHRLRQAIALLDGGQPAAAAHVLESLVNDHPGLPLAQCNLGTAYARLTRHQEAVAAFRRCLDFQPDQTAARLSLAQSLVSLHEYEQALAEVRAVERAKPGASLEFDVLYIEGLCLRRLNRLPDARVALSRAIALKPGHADATANLGYVLARLGRLEEAASKLRSARDLNPDSPEISFQFAAVLRQQGKIAQAKDESARTQQIRNRQRERELAATLTRQANDALAAGDAGSAVRLYREALGRIPDSAEAYFNLALALGRTGDRKGQETALRQSIAREPGFAAAHNEMGKARLAANDAPGAEREFRAAIQSDPDFAHGHLNLGLLLNALGRSEEALGYLEAAVELAPEDPAVGKALAAVKPGYRP